ncbi:MAG: hypothetical protein U5M50_06675 [Sphingobium sp.]|nr:hypothetical protein [Sphingobium sp.]
MMIRLPTTALLLPLAALALASCGGRVALKPEAGKSMPPAAVGATGQPSVDQLLTPSTQARPQRNAELLRKSEPRTEDPFDLPPKN